MIPPNVAMIVLGVYALLLAVGGVMGYAKAKSRPSLIAGTASAVLELIALALTWRNIGFGLWLGAFIAVGLTVFFGMRYFKNRKFMPGGMMAVVSLVVTMILTLALIPG